MHVSDRYRSIFAEALSIERRRCLYLRRWISRTSSGRRFGSSFRGPNGNEQRQRAADRGVIHVTFCTGFSGYSGREHRGQTCQIDIRPTRPASVAFRSGRAKACSIESCAHLRETFISAARSTSRKLSSTVATPAQKKGSSGWENSTRQGDQDHGSGRRPWSSSRHRDCEWSAT